MSTNNLLISTLIEFGMSEKEARVYLSLLESDSSSVQVIANNAGVNRSSAYVILEAMKNKGFAFSVDGKRKYVAAPPETLLAQLEDTATRTRIAKEKIKEIFPDLKALHRETKHKPTVRIFQGREEIKRIHEIVLSEPKGTTIRAFSQPNVWEDMEEDYFEKLSKKRVLQEINLRVIYPQKIKEKGNFSDTEGKKRLARARFLPKTTSPLSSDFRVFGNKIALTSAKDSFGIIIENAEIAEAVKFIFDLAWEHSEKY